MKISMRCKSNNHTVIALLTYLVCFSINVDQAFSAGGSDPQPTTNIDPLVSSPTVQNVGSLSLPTTLQQSGINNFANINTTNPVNCGGLCLYGNIKSGSSSIYGLNPSSGSQFEGSLGFMWQPSSPDQTNLETQRRQIEAIIAKSEDEQKILLMQKLVEAVNTNNSPMARGMAILLAPKLSKTLDQLLNEVMGKSR